jgi:hypothetical protein
MDQRNHLNFSQEQLLERVGSMEQLAPVQRFQFIEGRAKSVEAYRVETGAGLAFTTLVDRGLDLADVTYRGRSLCWRSSAGIVAPN